MNSISIKNIIKSDEQLNILDDLSIDFQQGKIHGIISKCANDKHTLLQSITGFTFIDSGEIYVEEKLIENNDDYHNKLGVAMQKQGFIYNLSGYKNLRFLANINNNISDEQIKQALIQVGLDPCSKKWFYRYTSSMKKRLCIAQAIMENQKIIIIEEPFCELNYEELELIKLLLLKLKNENKTILLASSELKNIEMICDSICEIKNGKVSLIYKKYLDNQTTMRVINDE